MQIKNFIGGEWLSTDQQLTKIDPSTAQRLYELPDSDELTVVRAIQAAHQAFENWSKTAIDQRSRILLRAADLLEKRLDEFANLESEDVGKPVELARTMDIPRAIHNLRFFATLMLHLENISTDLDGKVLNYTQREPIGVVALITPWNLPLYLLTWKLAPALMSGNAVVCKPSELASRTAYEFCHLLKEAGLPPGVCNMIFGRGEVAGHTLVAHPGVRAVSFTGGTETGETIAKTVSPQFKKMSLELGGKNAAIILSDADLHRAILGTVRSSFLNQGEICLCTSRIFVQETIYEQFLEGFIKEVNELVIGDPKDKNTFMGPLISQEHLEKVRRAIQYAVEQGAKIVSNVAPLNVSEKLKNGYFIRPTVLTDVSNCSELHHQEIFGPVVTIQPFKYPPEAIKFANTAPYGLAATLWTQDLSKAHRLAPTLKVGTVWINTWLQRDLRVPFGGMKASGLGREGGKHSIDFFTELKTISVGL